MSTDANLRYVAVDAAGLLLRNLLEAEYPCELSSSLWSAMALAYDMHPDATEIEQLANADRLPAITAGSLLQTLATLHTIRVLGVADKLLGGFIERVLQHYPSAHEIRAMAMVPSARALMSRDVRDLSRDLTVAEWIYPPRDRLI